MGSTGVISYGLLWYFPPSTDTFIKCKVLIQLQTSLNNKRMHLSAHPLYLFYLLKSEHFNNQGSGKQPFPLESSGEHQAYPVELGGDNSAS